MQKNISKKNFDEYDRGKPESLLLFELLLPQEQKYSNSIELYDFIPKYFWGKAQRVDGQYLKPLEREFEHRGESYVVQIDPANIKGKDGVIRSYFPSKREELVEDALRKFACEGQGLFLDEAASVTFTLNQLQEELRSRGHSFSKDELKDSLLVCAKTQLTVSTKDGRTLLVSSLFETLGLQSREDHRAGNQKTFVFVRFNPLVTASIKQRTFRQFNYEKSMAYKSVIARRLHKRMAHYYVQASIGNSYSILLSTLIRDFGLTAYASVAHNLRDVCLALDEMKEKDVLLNYKVDKLYDSYRRGKIVDAKLHLTPTHYFAGEVIRANTHLAKIIGVPKLQGEKHKALKF